MKLKEFFDMVEKAKKDMTPEQLEREVLLYVSNPYQIHDLQYGEYGITPRLLDAFLSDRTLHIRGG